MISFSAKAMWERPKGKFFQQTTPLLVAGHIADGTLAVHKSVKA